MRSQVTTSVAGFFKANHFGAISALLFSFILSACSGGYDNVESNDYASPSLTEVTVQDADAPLNTDVVVDGTFQINITSDEALIAPTVMINGVAADSVRGSGTSWTASKVMTEDDAVGLITFTITYMDLNTNPGADVSATTDGSAITFCAAGCDNSGTTDGTTDGGTTDGTTDGGTTDGGTTDGGTTDGSTDGGATDGGTTDGGTVGPAVQMIEGFGGAELDEATSIFTVPAASEGWAGYANMEEGIYPFALANGGTITFTAAIPAGGSDTTVYFRFERLPHPDVDPSYNTANIVVSGEAEQEYSVAIPAQDAANTYASFLMYVVERDSPIMVKNIVVTDDSGSTGGATDGGATDGGATDGGATDGGTTDGGATDGGATDGGATDGGATDGGATDGGVFDGPAVEMIEGFGGAEIDEATSIFTVPGASEGWAGYANLNEEIYPFTLASGGKVTFTAAIPAGGSDTTVYFRFERLPHPDVDPSYNTANVVVSGEAEQEYSVDIPAQDAANTYASFLMYVVERDSPIMVKNIVVTDDSGSTGGATDGGATDGGATDGGATDGGATDGGVFDGPAVDMIEGFGGAEIDEATSIFTVPGASEGWAGYANMEEGIYPFTLASGGKVTFTAAIPAGGSDTTVYFRFERLPHPDVDPSYNTANVVVSGEAEQEYSVDIPAQDAANTYASFLMYVVERDSPIMVKNIVVTDDSGSTGGTIGGGTTDGGATDGGATDGGATDGGATDGGATDGGATDGSASEGPAVEMIEGFGGAEIDEATSIFTVPGASEGWAGYANMEEGIYPFTLASGGKVTFTAAIPAGGSDTTVYFRFERLPHPDVDPSYNTANVVVSGEAEQEYSVDIPAQDAANTYASFLMYVVERDSPIMVTNIVVTDDSGSTGSL